MVIMLWKSDEPFSNDDNNKGSEDKNVNDDDNDNDDDDTAMGDLNGWSWIGRAEYRWALLVCFHLLFYGFDGGYS